MIIYPQEEKDDIADLVSAASAFTIASLAEPSDKNSLHLSKASIESLSSSLASYNDSDLYYVQSILVSSSWNKNDDIFAKEEVWAAKNTPEDKPTNLEHNENLIIGHIISNWPIDENGNTIDENVPISEIPDKFHIVTGSVIYKAFSNPELRERSAKLIAEIENGTKYVSMECMFGGFDYGLINKTNGSYKILNRSNETAFLTKYLRAYGGKGEYDNYKIGRVLRNITFSGKGYVDKPANPDSIIFTKENLSRSSASKNNKNSFSGVSEIRPILTENKTMSLENQITETSEEVVAMNNCEEAHTLASTLKDQITSLEASLKAEQEAHAALQNEVAEAAKKMEEEKKMKEEEMKKMKAEIVALDESLAAYKNKEMEMMKKEKKMKRMASLIENGLDQETASSAVDQFESLEDSAFDAMVVLVTSAAKKAKMVEAPKEMKAKNSEAAELVEDALDNAEPNTSELDLSAGSDVTESVNTTRAALVDFVCARLGKKLNKGE